MSAKDIKFGRGAQALVKEGVDKLANAVKATLGPRAVSYTHLTLPTTPYV